MNRIIARLEESAKAIVALATPIIVATITDVLGELTIAAQGAITAAATAISVWLVRNRPPKS